MKKNFDITVVGDGILGISTAFSLLQKDPSLKIAIVAPQCANAASLAAGAMLNCFAEITETSLSTEAKKEKFQMSVQALRKWPSWIAQINEQSSKKLAIKSGTYVLLNARSGALDTRNFLSMIEALEAYSEPYQEVSPEEVPGINPTDLCRPLRAIYLPNEGFLNPVEIIGVLKEILISQYDVTFINDAVKTISYQNNVVEGVVLESGERIFAKKVLLATGAYTQKIIDSIPEINTKIPMTLAGKGLALIVKSESHSIDSVIRTPNRAGACGLHIVPRGGNCLYVGATNNVYLTPQESVHCGLTEFLIRCAIEQIDQEFYNAEIQDWVVGNRPMTIDSLPLIGQVSIKGLYLLAGTYRDGFHMSPYLAEYMANLMLDDVSEADNIFTPERPFIHTMNKTDSIEEFLMHYIAGSYEHGIVLPPFLPQELILDSLRQKVYKIYDDLNIDFGLAPEIILMVIFSKEPEHVIELLKQNLADIHTSLS